MKKMKTLTFPNGETYEVVDAEARQSLNTFKTQTEESIGNLNSTTEKIANKVSLITSTNKSSESSYPNNKAITDYINNNTASKAWMEEVNQKISKLGGKIKIDYNGSKLFIDGTQINFKTLLDLLEVSKDFVVLAYNNRAYHVTTVQNASGSMKYITFSSPVNDGGISKNSEIQINSNDGVNIAGIKETSIANENINNKVSEITDRNKSDENSYTSIKAVVDYVEESTASKNQVVIKDESEITDDTKLFIKSEDDEIEIPTIDELNEVKGDLDSFKGQIENGITERLYTDLSSLTQKAASGNANAYLYTVPFRSGYIGNITLRSTASGTIKLYIYKLENGTYIPTEMYFVNAVSGENVVEIEKIIDYDFYIAFSSYNGADVVYTNAYSAENNTAWIDSGEPTAKAPANAFYFGIDVNYGSASKAWEFIGSPTYKHSLFLNTPDYAVSSKASTGAYNAYFVYEKFDKGFVKRIYIKGLESGSTTVILYRLSGNAYVPFRSFTKNTVSGENFIDVNEWIYCDFYVAISGKFGFVNKYVGDNNTKWITLGASIPITDTPSGKYYFGVYFEYETKPTAEKYKNRIYNLHDAFMAWNEGKKFPVCFAGDSTTDGYQTTDYAKNVIGTDHILPNIYTKLLEDYLKSEFTSNTSLRIYNAGFSGQTAAWFDSNFDAEIINNEHYADTLMLGISFGINDRVKTASEYSAVMSRFENIIKKCYDNGIQPFMLTSQAGVEYSSRDTVKRYEYLTHSYANKIKFELAEKYNLELIDVSKYTHNFIRNSNYSGEQIIADHCHFNDIGHKYEAGMFFAHFVPRTIWADAPTKIGFDSYGIKTALTSDANAASEIKTLNEVENGFKMKAAATNTTDKTTMDVCVFIDSDKPLSLKSYCSNAYSQYIIVDGVSHNITATEQEITTLDLGLHRITVMSGTGNIDFYGFKLV